MSRDLFKKQPLHQLTWGSLGLFKRTPLLDRIYLQ